MKRRVLIKCVITLVSIVVFQSMVYGQSKKYDYKDFTSVSVGYGMHLKVNQSQSYSIEVKGNKKDLEVVEVDKSGDNLNIHITRDHYRLRDEVYISISMPELTELNLGGGSEGDISMNVNSKSFRLSLSGGSSLEGKLSCGNTEMGLSGGSIVDLSGKCNDLVIDGSGGSIFKLKDFSAKDTDSQLSGGSQARVRMDGKLNTEQSGGSQLIYYGNVKIGATDFSGGSFAEAGD